MSVKVVEDLLQPLKDGLGRFGIGPCSVIRSIRAICLKTSRWVPVMFGFSWASSGCNSNMVSGRSSNLVGDKLLDQARVPPTDTEFPLTGRYGA